jgi:hypothetical protein
MSNAKKFAGTAAAVLVLGLAPIGLSAAKAAAADRLQLSMMDEDKMRMKSDSSKSNSMGNMGQSGGQPQNMGGGGMQDDRMRMQMPGMQECQGPGCQQGSSMQGSNMMQMMERMHRQVNPPSGMMPGGNTASGPADVTERLEGRIAFLKAELQITDKQVPDWNVLADALRSSRQHLLEARKLLVMDDKMQGTERLDHYERHLSERLEAIKSARAAFGRLYGTLNDGQKKTADALLLPLISTF